MPVTKQKSAAKREVPPARQLLAASSRQDVVEVVRLLKRYPTLHENVSANHAMAFAARLGNMALLSALLDSGFDLNAGTWYGDDSAHTNLERPIHWAAGHGQLDAVRFMLDRGADVEGTLRFFTPLAVAARAGHKAIYELLLDRGAKLHFHVAAAVEGVTQLGGGSRLIRRRSAAATSMARRHYSSLPSCAGCPW